MSTLKGKTIITTCAEFKANKVKQILKPKEAIVYNFPLISIQPADEHKEQIKKDLAHLSNMDWIVFTSTNGVKYFFHWLSEFNIKIDYAEYKFACIGSATNAELRKFGASSEFNIEAKDATEFAENLSKHLGNSKKQILIPSGNIAKESIENVLGGKHSIQKVVVYNTFENTHQIKELSDLIRNNSTCYVLFLSPSAVRGFKNSLTADVLISSVKCIPIGKITNLELTRNGFTPLIIPEIPNIESMIITLENYIERNIEN